MNYDTLNLYRTQAQRDNRWHRIRRGAGEWLLAGAVSLAFWGVLMFILFHSGTSSADPFSQANFPCSIDEEVLTAVGPNRTGCVHIEEIRN